jgi:broad specificity polyphosphatase/5'/3'-nucleotidase SurE
VVSDPLPSVVLNVNFPARRTLGVIEATRPARRSYRQGSFGAASADGVTEWYQPFGEAGGGDQHPFELHIGSDAAAVAAGRISVTSLPARCPSVGQQRGRRLAAKIASLT